VIAGAGGDDAGAALSVAESRDGGGGNGNAIVALAPMMLTRAANVAADLLSDKPSPAV
jgi:hypothetical protein